MAGGSSRWFNVWVCLIKVLFASICRFLLFYRDTTYQGEHEQSPMVSYYYEL